MYRASMALRNAGFYGLNMKFLKTQPDLYLPRDCSVNIQRGSDGRVVPTEGYHWRRSMN